MIKGGKPIKRLDEIEQKFLKNKHELTSISSSIQPPTGVKKRRLIKAALKSKKKAAKKNK
jgi:hypothetical protein